MWSSTRHSKYILSILATGICLPTALQGWMRPDPSSFFARILLTKNVLFSGIDFYIACSSILKESNRSFSCAISFVRLGNSNFSTINADELQSTAIEIITYLIQLRTRKLRGTLKTTKANEMEISFNLDLCGRGTLIKEESPNYALWRTF